MGVSRSSGCMTYHRLQSVNRSLTLAPSNLNARPSPCTSVYSADTCADALPWQSGRPPALILGRASEAGRRHGARGITRAPKGLQ